MCIIDCALYTGQKHGLAPPKSQDKKVQQKEQCGRDGSGRMASGEKGPTATLFHSSCCAPGMWLHEELEMQGSETKGLVRERENPELARRVGGGCQRSKRWVTGTQRATESTRLEKAVHQGELLGTRSLIHRWLSADSTRHAARRDNAGHCNEGCGQESLRDAKISGQRYDGDPGCEHGRKGQDACHKGRSSNLTVETPGRHHPIKRWKWTFPPGRHTDVTHTLAWWTGDSTQAHDILAPHA